MAAPVYGVAEGRALGCGLRLVTAEPEAVPAAWRAVESMLAEVDLAASRFRPDSEIARINAEPGGLLRLSPLLNAMVGHALRAAARTRGAVDPTVGAAVRLAGYDRDFAEVAPEAGPLRLLARPVTGWRSLAHDEARRTLRLPRGVELDLGATGKALAADLAADAAAQAAGCGVLVSLGGDIAAAGRAPEGGWPVQVSEDSGAALGPKEETISLRGGGLATSSTTIRRWRRGEAVLHHIIDPRTGLPAAGPWRTVTVAAASCVDANTAATAAIALAGDGLDWLLGSGLPARLVASDGAVRRLGGWPEPPERAV